MSKTNERKFDFDAMPPRIREILEAHCARMGDAVVARAFEIASMLLVVDNLLRITRSPNFVAEKVLVSMVKAFLYDGPQPTTETVYDIAKLLVEARANGTL